MMISSGSFFRCSVAALLVSSLSACSFLFTTKPRPRDANSPPGPVECTSSKALPIVDSSVVLGESIFLIAALARDDDSFGKQGVNRGLYIGGTSVVAAVFLASALYGYDVTSKCQVRKGQAPDTKAPSSPGGFPAPDEDRGRRSRDPDPWASLVASGAQPPDVPKTVAGFSFAATVAEAEKTCTATQRAWDLRGRIGRCSPKVEDTAAETARLEFELGKLSKIVILHQPAQDAFNKDYDKLDGKLRVRYGKPQVPRAPLSDECAASLVECMKRGETPAGSKWFLRAGRIELLPTWRDDRAFIEERYTREEPPSE